MLQPVTQLGAFTKGTADIINSNFNAVSNPDLWVRPQYGNNNTATGTYERPYATVAGALSASILRPGMTIGVLGVIFEGDITAPIINDITIAGMANWPRQATTSGVANGGGATWLAPSGGCTNLITVQGQAWTFKNLYLNNAANSASTTSNIKVLTTGDPPASADGAHVSVEGCIFTGGNTGAGTAYGFYTQGGTNYVNITGCRFFNFTGTGETAIAQVTGLGIATLSGWNVSYNQFYNNVNSIVLPSTTGFFEWNTFVSVGPTVTATTLLSLTNGVSNTIQHNKFGLASDASGIATIVAMGTTPNAGPNYYNDVTEYGQPAE